MKKLKNLKWPVPPYAHKYLILCFVNMMCAYYLTRVIGITPKYDFTLPVDRSIPLLPLFSYIYIFAYAYWALSYIYISRFSEAFSKRLFTADLIGKIVSLACFFLLPCSLARPEISDIHGAGAWLTKIIYTVDEPNNLLPSLHCFVSYICFRPLLSKSAPPSKPAILIISFSFSVLVCLSTLFTRQHVLIDLISGIALGEAAWLLSGYFLKKIDRAKQLKDS